MTRSDLYDDAADRDVWSNTSVGGRRLTWKELVEHEREELYRLRKLSNILMSLDRCVHGRHEGDICSSTSGCDGPSRGNPFVGDYREIGYTIRGTPIVVPDAHRMHEPEAWTP